MCSSRSDLASGTGPVIGNGPFGEWESCFHYCPEGSYAYGIRLKSEDVQGESGDDTALNGIKIRCWNPTTGNFAGEVAGAESPWGDYLDFAECGPWEEPLSGGQMHIFAAAGARYDDLTATDVLGWCHDPRAPIGLPFGPIISPPTYYGGGVLTTLRGCPVNSAVCGVRTKLEASQGGGWLGGDDTALNGVQFSCCRFSLPI